MLPSRKYALKEGGPKRLKIATGPLARKYTIELDGKPLARGVTRKALRDGWTYTNTNGSTLRIVYKTTFLSNGYDFYINDKLLPASVSHPTQRLKSAYIALYLIAVLNGFLGLYTLLSVVPLDKLLAVLSSSDALEFLPIQGVLGVFFGVVFAVIASFAHRRSRMALGIAIVILVVDALLGLIGSGGILICALLFRVWIVVILLRGFNAAAELDVEAAKQQPSSAIWVNIAIGIVATILVLFVLSVVIFRGMPVTNPLSDQPPANQTIGPTPAPMPSHHLLSLDAIINRVIYDPALNRGYGLGQSSSTISIIDLAQGKQDKILNMPNPVLDACVNPITHNLFVLHQGSAITEVDSVHETIKGQVNWQPTDFARNALSYDVYTPDIYCAENGVYVSLFTNRNEVWWVSLDGNTTLVQYRGSSDLCENLGSALIPPSHTNPNSSVHESLVISLDGSAIYYACLLSRSSGTLDGADFIHAQISGEHVSGAEAVFLPQEAVEENLSARPSFDEITGHGIFGSTLFSMNPPTILNTFDEPILAVDWHHNRAMGLVDVYDLDTYEFTIDLVRARVLPDYYTYPYSAFFDSAGGVYIPMSKALMYVDLTASS